MDPSTLFRFCNLAVLPGWAMLVFLPRWRLTRELIPAVILPLALTMVYLYLVVAYFGAAKDGFGSLDGFRRFPSIRTSCSPDGHSIRFVHWQLGVSAIPKPSGSAICSLSRVWC